MMKKVVLTVGILALASALFIAPGFLAAQNNEVGQGKQETKSSKAHGKSSMMQGNMGRLAEITHQIYEMMKKGQMNSEQREQILDIMKQMSRMMKEMSVPHDEPVKKRHKIELNEMSKTVDTMYKHVFQ